MPIAATSNIAKFFEAAIDLVAKSTTFQNRIVQYTSETVASEAIAKKFIHDDTEPEIVDVIEHNNTIVVKPVPDKCPMVVLFIKAHQSANTNSCNNFFDYYATSIELIITDLTRLKDVHADVSPDHRLDAYIDFANFYGGVIEDIQNGMPNSGFFFENIQLEDGPDRSAIPDREEADMFQVRFSLNSDIGGTE